MKLETPRLWLAMMKHWLPLILIVSGLIVFFSLGLQQYLQRFPKTMI